MNKIIEIVSSTRFIQLLIVAFLQSLVLFNVITSDQGEGLTNIISALLIGSVTIRTIDRNTGDVKAGNTTVSIPQNVTTVSAKTTSKTTGTKKK